MPRRQCETQPKCFEPQWLEPKWLRSPGSEFRGPEPAPRAPGHGTWPRDSGSVAILAQAILAQGGWRRSAWLGRARPGRAPARPPCAMAAWGPFGQRRSVMAVAGDIEMSDGGFWCQCGRARWPLAGAARSAVPVVDLIAHAWADGLTVGLAGAPAGGLTAAEVMRRGQLALVHGGAEAAANAGAAPTVAEDLVQPHVVCAAVVGVSGRCGSWHVVRSRLSAEAPPAAGGARGPGPDHRGRDGVSLGCREGRGESPGTAVQHSYAGVEVGP